MASILSFVFSFVSRTITHRIDHEHEYDKCPNDCPQEYEFITERGEVSNVYPLGKNKFYIIGFRNHWYVCIEDARGSFTIGKRTFMMEDDYDTRQQAIASFRECEPPYTC